MAVILQLINILPIYITRESDNGLTIIVHRRNWIRKWQNKSYYVVKKRNSKLFSANKFWFLSLHATSSFYFVQSGRKCWLVYSIYIVYSISRDSFVCPELFNSFSMKGKSFYKALSLFRTSYNLKGPFIFSLNFNICVVIQAPVVVLSTIDFRNTCQRKGQVQIFYIPRWSCQTWLL